MGSDAFDRFVRTMKVGYIEWHDGIGYDLDALDSLTGEERRQAEDLVMAREGADVRDIAALDRIGSERALAAVCAAATSERLEVRMAAVWRLARRGLLSEQQVEETIINALDHATFHNGANAVLTQASVFRSPALRRKVLATALDGQDEWMRLRSAELANFLYGGSPTLGNSAFQPLYSRFKSEDRDVRYAAYLELCEGAGIPPDLV